ncbi:DUF6221 family protein [Streptomyces asiaticus]|uniref:DUF6221 family protein n=1 Tax=Streptomyces asiaticus TaxID=114695 RepID=UPI003806795F
MDELVRWLGEQLDTDEQVARDATMGPWQNAPTASHYATATGQTEEAVFASPPDVGTVVVASTGEARDRKNLRNAEHIVRFADPARVLREIDAKRRIIAEVVPEARKAEAMINEEWGSGSDTDGDLLRLLALPYANRPGYREEWRP